MENDVKSNTNARLLCFGPFRLDAVERRLFKDGAQVALPGKAFDLLLLLAEANGHLKSRDELIESLWPTTIVVENSLSFYVGVVRRALGDENGATYIETVRGHGYRFIAPVEVESPDEPDIVGASLLATADTADTRVASKLPPTGDGAGAGAASAEIPSSANSIAAKATPTRRRTTLSALAAVAIVVIVGVLVWRFAPLGSGGEGAAASTPSIAVLPFENLSADKTNAFFAAGIRDTILSKLASLSDLRVISRTSTERYASHPTDLHKVATQLDVSTILEGSVQKSGNQVMINVQLINVATNDHIWAHVYTRKLADVFAMESDVATQVATALKAELLPTESNQLAQTSTHDPQAYLLFLKANYYANQLLRNWSTSHQATLFTQAVALYHQAIARDPRYSLAWARLARLEILAYWFVWDRDTRSLANATKAAKQALTIDPDLAQAHLAMGYVEYYGHRNYAAALAQFEQAAQRLPNNAQVLGAIARIERRQGKWQDALKNFRRAAKVDPRDPRWRVERGVAFAALRRYDQAQHQFDLALAIEPQNFRAKTREIWALLLAGKSGEARKALDRMPRDTGPYGVASSIAFEALWLSHEPDLALKALNAAPIWLQSVILEGMAPKSLLKGRAFALEGNLDQAHQAYEDAQTKLKTALHQQPGRPDWWSMLGMAEAGLGQKNAAIRDGRRAVQLLPVSKDAMGGPYHLAALAKIYAQVGEPEQAVKLLRRLFDIPAGWIISVPLLKADPVWDPIRQNKAFQALLKQHKP